MNLEEKILELLFKPRFRYKGISVSMLFLPVFSSYKKQSIRNSLSQLKKSGYVITAQDKIIISKVGQKLAARRFDELQQFSSCFSKKDPKNLIVMYDIPEGKKGEREWLRFHLRKFNYEMIHRSVWVGPSPLPREFIAYIKKLGLGNNIKVLRLAQNYSAHSFQI